MATFADKDLHSFASGNYVVCSGTILSATMVLSAYHCFWTKKLRDELNVHVVVGEHDTTQSGEMYETLIEIKQLYPHPDPLNKNPFDCMEKDCKITAGMHPPLKFDMILLEMKFKIDFTDGIQPMCIATAMPDIKKTKFSISGWGITRRTPNCCLKEPPDCTQFPIDICYQNLKAKSHILKTATVMVIDHEKCKAEGRIWGYSVAREVICAANQKTGESTCKADSGGKCIKLSSDVFHMFCNIHI